MRGRVDRQQTIFVAFNLEQIVPEDHPLRKIKRWADGVLSEISRDFNKAYGTTGHPGIPPERLIKALLLQALYSIPSETNALRMLRHVEKRHKLVPRTIGMDAGYKAGEFLCEIEAHGSTPHVPIPAEQIKGDSPPAQARRRARRRMKTVGYRLSQRVRSPCEQIIGWSKTVAGLARTRRAR